MELTKEELRIILDWYETAKVRQDIRMDDFDIDLYNKIKGETDGK